jgi:hypothetical protein
MTWAPAKAGVAKSNEMAAGQDIFNRIHRDISPAP